MARENSQLAYRAYTVIKREGQDDFCERVMKFCGNTTGCLSILEIDQDLGNHRRPVYDAWQIVGDLEWVGFVIVWLDRKLQFHGGLPFEGHSLP